MGAKSASTGAKKIVVVKKSAGNSTNDKKSKDANYQNRDRNNDRRSQRQYEGSDDGMSYNPFAALLKK